MRTRISFDRQLGGKGIVIPCVFLVLCLFCPHYATRAEAETLLFDLSDPSYRLLEDNKFNDVGVLWVAEGNAFISSGDMISKQRAGILRVMATIVFEKANTAEAYITWSDAIRFFLESQTTWEEVQTELRRTYNKLQQELQTAQPSPSFNAPNKREEEWFTVIEQLQLLAYKGPTPGLKQKQQKTQDNARPAQIRYIPRPHTGEKMSPTPPQESEEATSIHRGIEIKNNPSTVDTIENE